MPKAAESQSFDISKASFPLQLVILLAATLVSGLMAAWGAQRGNDTQIQTVTAKMDVVLEKMTSAETISRLRDEAYKAQFDNMREEIKSLKANSQLLQLQQQALQLELAKRKN